MTGGVGPRRSVRLAAVAAAAVLAGMLPGTDSAASGGSGDLSLSYACQFASGEQDVTVDFAQAYPPVAEVGGPIQPGELTATVTIARAGATALLPADAATVTGTADLKAHVAQGKSLTYVDWPGLSADSTEVAGAGDLEVAFTGKVPGVSVTAPGEVAFSAGDLTLTLHPRAAAGTPAPPVTPTPTGADAGADADAGAGSGAGSGTAAPADTAPTGGSTAAPLPDVTGTCAAKPGQDTALATVSVPGGSKGVHPPGGSASGGRSGTTSSTGSSPTASAGSRQGQDGTIVPLAEPPHSGRTTCDTPPPPDFDPARLPKTNPGAIILPLPGQPPFPTVPLCGYVAGFSNVNKLNGAMVVNDPYGSPGLATVNSGQRKVLDIPHNYIEVDSTLALQLPTSNSTFLTYGFMPTSAEVDFVPRGVFTVVAFGQPNLGTPAITTIGGYQDLRIHNVELNGTPLDVGSNCHTVTPLDVVLTGRADEALPGGGDGRPDYELATGGPLTDENLVIPPFTGCGSHGENLDALFTASLSGPGNTLNLSQAPLCDPTANPKTCLPEIPLPSLPKRG